MHESSVFSDLANETLNIIISISSILPYLFGYIVIILASLFIWRTVRRGVSLGKNYNSLKTVTFGDESTVVSNKSASIVSVLLIFLLWGSFTGSKLLPGFLHMPGPYVGSNEFTYTAQNDVGEEDSATVSLVVHVAGEKASKPTIKAGDGIAVNDVMVIQAYRSKLLAWDLNDQVKRKWGGKIVKVNDQPISKNNPVDVGFARVSLTDKGTLNVVPHKGIQMEHIYLPAPEQVWTRLVNIANQGYQNVTLGQHLGFSLWRVIIGFLIGALVGIPLGYAMGLSNWFRGWFDPIVEFMRPVPPLALIPLVIIWAGIGEEGKVVLLFLAALWIMAIAARSGVSGVRITKIHAAYSLGASKFQILLRVIIPNSLPEIFTGARVAMGVCWGTVVAAELVAAEKGLGKMIVAASKFQNTDVVIMGIVLIGVIGFAIDVGIRLLEKYLVPWKGKG
ncbi:MAG: ABC transporter permease subunit [Gammaproteobacteria bacterium]|jgi:taurine transport system permease protein|nr:ABC transporter permease subunit [Gammaproteobacteria bacterium]